MIYMIRNEWGVHQCKDADKYTAEHRKEMTRIAGNPYSNGCRGLYNTTTEGTWIRYCPWCGCDLDKEEIAEERLPKRYVHPMWKVLMKEGIE